MSHYAIIVAGGTGSRMKSDIPKQFLLLDGKPILMHTIQKFKAYEVTIVLPEDQIKYWDQLCDKYDFEQPHKRVVGGTTRFQSVKNGLDSIPNTGLVAIHDGVRPLVTDDIISTSFELAKTHGNAISAVPLKDSIREITTNGNKTADRSKFELIQTPQTFEIELIKKAYQQEESPSFTDDASVLECIGHDIQLFKGSYSNIKITTPEDLKVAEALLK